MLKGKYEQIENWPFNCTQYDKSLARREGGVGKNIQIIW